MAIITGGKRADGFLQADDCFKVNGTARYRKSPAGITGTPQNNKSLATPTWTFKALLWSYQNVCTEHQGTFKKLLSGSVFQPANLRGIRASRF